MGKNVRVRFAPSPTGPLHIGGVRTALFNYLFAKKNGGKFILRIEDTDQTRLDKKAEKYIKDSLKWCGIIIDEGIGKRGGNQRRGPYRQSLRARRKIYNSYCEELLKIGKAYYAFDTPDELEKLREEFSGRGEVFMYNYTVRGDLKNSLALSEEKTKALLQEGVPYVVRFRIDPGEPLPPIHDKIRGDLTFDSSTLDDKVLFKSDGMPTYHLANVVDDYLMGITHVIRGEEWLPSLPLHVLLYRAFGWKPPAFAHLPLILKPAGKGKLSKRDGDKMDFPVFPLEWKTPEGEIYPGYREQGYFPEAFVNMLVLLGWNAGNDREIYSMQELIESFSLERIGKSGARFDPRKARWFNHQYLLKKSNREITEAYMKILEGKGVNAGFDYVEKVVSMMKERVDFIRDLWEESSFFFVAPVDYEEKTVKKYWKGDIPHLMRQIEKIIQHVEPFNNESLGNTIKEWIDSHALGMGKIMTVLRLLLIGVGTGPNLFNIMEIIGKEETLRRIRA